MTITYPTNHPKPVYVVNDSTTNIPIVESRNYIWDVSSLAWVKSSSPDGSSTAVSVVNFPSVQPVSQSGVWNINDISGVISLPTGASTSDLQTSGNASLSSIDSKLNSLGQKTLSGSVPVAIASDQTVIPVNDNGSSLSVDQSGVWSVRITDSSGNSFVLGPTTGANSIPVVIANDQDRSSTCNHSDVAGSSTVVTLQAANSARLGWSLFNDSFKDWYIRWGSSASLTNFDVIVTPGAYLEIPFRYTGIITGIQPVANGFARVSEFIT